MLTTLSIRFIAVFLCFMSLFSLAFGQDCDQILKSAEEHYERGDQGQVLPLIASCLDDTIGIQKVKKNGRIIFNVDKQVLLVRVYRLLVLNYAFDKATLDSAEYYMGLLLSIKPDYAPTESDPPVLKQIRALYRSWPIGYLHFRGGMNTQFVQVLQTYGIENLQNPQAMYGLLPGYQTSLGFDFALGDRWDLGAELQFSSYKFWYENELSTFGSSRPSFARLQLTELQRSFRLPILAKRKFLLGSNKRTSERNWSLYLQAGAALTYMWKADLRELSRINVGTGSQPTTSFSVRSLRQRWNYAGVLGLGISWKQQFNNWFFDVRYVGQVRNQAHPDHRYDLVQGSSADADIDLLYTYGYVSDDLRLHSFEFSFGLSRAIYRINREGKGYQVERRGRKKKDPLSPVSGSPNSTP